MGIRFGASRFSHMFHSIGMFGFTVPIGHLADRFGRERVMYPGVAMTLVGAIFVTLGSEYCSVTYRYVPGRHRLGGCQCRVDRADRRP